MRATVSRTRQSPQPINMMVWRTIAKDERLAERDETSMAGMATTTSRTNQASSSERPAKGEDLKYIIKGT